MRSWRRKLVESKEQHKCWLMWGSDVTTACFKFTLDWQCDNLICMYITNHMQNWHTNFIWCLHFNTSSLTRETYFSFTSVTNASNCYFIYVNHHKLPGRQIKPFLSFEKKHFIILRNRDHKIHHYQHIEKQCMILTLVSLNSMKTRHGCSFPCKWVEMKFL